MHAIQQVLETALYADDLDRAEAFYRDCLGFEVIGKDHSRHVFFAVANSVLLVFNADETSKGHTLPAHGARGPGHVAFAIAADALVEWRGRLRERGVAVEKEVYWPRGGTSLYFRDPAGNLLELVTPGCWGLPSGW
jgi:catechol 2,3-dioxygenase-like lactoylglutathione lyase family enzyme